MNNEYATDRLIIPLDYVMEKTQGSNNPIKMIGTLLIILVMALAFYGRSIASLSPYNNNSIVFILISGFVAYSVMRNFGQTKSLVKANDGTKTQVLILDSQGITCPLTLLFDQEKESLEKAGRTSLQIAWDEIESWTASTRPVAYSFRGHFNYGYTYDWWLLKLKAKIGVLQSRTIAIKKDSLIEHEQDIFDFSQRFFPFKVAPMNVTLANSWPAFLILGSVAILIIIAIAKHHS